MFFAAATQPLPPLCACALMYFSLPCIADNVTLEVLVKCCLAGCVVKLPPPPGASKGNGFVIDPRSGPHPLVFPNLPSCPTPILLHMYCVVYGDAHVATCTFGCLLFHVL